MSQLTSALWQRYRATGDPVARAQLLDAHLGLVHHCARDLKRRLGAEVEFDDLLGAGTLGLVQAIEMFDVGRGLAFSTFAVPRIRGAMLDELRRRDWLPRSARDRARRVAQARAALEQRLERTPDEHQIAAELQVDVAVYRRWRKHLDNPVMVQLDARVTTSGGNHALHETIADPAARDPGEPLGEASRLEALGQALAGLPERDRLVLTLSYYENLSLKQIGEVLHVTESRVSQLRTRALARLRACVEQEEEAA